MLLGVEPRGRFRRTSVQFVERNLNFSGFSMKTVLLLALVCALLLGAAFAQRLPGGATPNHYSLTFAINFSTNSFEGDETIDLQLTKPSSAITLNALEIDFHEVTVTAAGRTQTAKVS